LETLPSLVASFVWLMHLDVRNQSIHMQQAYAHVWHDALIWIFYAWGRIHEYKYKNSNKIFNRFTCSLWVVQGFRVQTPNPNPFHTIKVPIWNVGFLLQLVLASEWSWVTILLLHFAITKLKALTIERNCQMFWYLSNYLFNWWIRCVVILI